MVLSHLYVEGRTLPYRTPLRSPSTREADGRRSGSTALTTAKGVLSARGRQAQTTDQRWRTEFLEKEHFPYRISESPTPHTLTICQGENDPMPKARRRGLYLWVPPKLPSTSLKASGRISTAPEKA